MRSAPWSSSRCLSNTPFVVGRAADQEVVGRPLAASFWPQASRSHSRLDSQSRQQPARSFGGDALALAPVRGHKAAVFDVDAIHRRFVANLHAQLFRAAVVGVDQRLAPPMKKALVRATCSAPDSGG